MLDPVEERMLAEGQSVATAMAEKRSALMTEDYPQERARRGSRAKYEAALAHVPDVEPDECDRI
jgi:hypothetical protein